MNSINFDDLNIFENFIKTTTFNYNNYYYIPYFIASPVYVFKEGKKNDAFLPLYLLILNKKDKKDFSFKLLHISWHAIHFYPLFTYIEKDYSLNSFEKEKKFKSFFDDEVLDINPNEVKKISFKDVLEEGFFKYFLGSVDEKLENEVFYEFYSKNKKSKDKNEKPKKYIISGIELVRYFYAKSAKNSLLNSLFYKERGLDLLYNELYISATEYRMYLKNDCNKDDAKYVLYFAHEDKFQEMFNSIFIRTRTEKYLYSNFPANDLFTIQCKTFVNNNVTLITRVTDSTLHNKLADKKLTFIHPNDKNIKSKSSSKNTPKPQKTETNPENDFDDSIDSIPTAGIIPIDEAVSSFLKKEALDIEFEKDKTEKSKPKRRTKYIESSETKITTSYGSKAGKGTKINLNTIFYPDLLEEASEIKYFNSIAEIKDTLKTKYKYDSIVKSFYFPDKKLKNNKLKKMAISFLNKDKTERRRYLLIKFISKKNKNFFFLDIEPNDDNQKKSILIIDKDISISECQEKYITKIIYDQVREGSHKWLSKYNHGLASNEYQTFDHKYKKISDLCDRIYDFIKLN